MRQSHDHPLLSRLPREPSAAHLNPLLVLTAIPVCVHCWLSLEKYAESQLDPCWDSFVFPAEHKIPCSLGNLTRRPRGAGRWEQIPVNTAAPNSFSLLKASTWDNSARRVEDRMGAQSCYSGLAAAGGRTEAGAAFSAIWKGLGKTEPVL